MKRTPPVRRTPLRRISLRRQTELRLYGARCAQFLAEHPFCQVWLEERGFDEKRVMAANGFVFDPIVRRHLRAPRATTIHHRNKRRGSRLLDERHWMAVSWSGHRQIEANKQWARTRGYLCKF